MDSSRWALADAELGVPLSIADGGEGLVVSYADRAVQQRHGTTKTVAVARTRKVLGQVFDAEAYDDGTRVVLDMREANSWRYTFTLDVSPIVRARKLCDSEPAVRIDGVGHTWQSLCDIVGQDSAMWALILSSSAKGPFILGSNLPMLASRTDNNPLALVRRAHAALVVRLQQAEVVAKSQRANKSDAAGDLLIALALLDRAAFDSVRTQRSRPVASAVSRCADAALRYLEVTPVTRTDLPLSHLARRVLADALTSARLAAPVPY